MELFPDVLVLVQMFSCDWYFFKLISLNFYLPGITSLFEAYSATPDYCNEEGQQDVAMQLMHVIRKLYFFISLCFFFHLKWISVTITVELQFKQLQSSLKKRSAKTLFFRATLQLLKLRFNCDGHIFISFVFLQFTSFHSVFFTVVFVPNPVA